MSSSDPLQQMEEILDQLIATAEKLKVLSQQTIHEIELTPLQQQQEALIAQLIECDKKIKTEHLENPNKDRMREKLHQFEELNRSYIENYKSTHGLLKFSPTQDDMIQPKRIAEES